jgi:hypothetical protein
MILNIYNCFTALYDVKFNNYYYYYVKFNLYLLNCYYFLMLCKKDELRNENQGYNYYTFKQ